MIYLSDKCSFFSLRKDINSWEVEDLKSHTFCLPASYRCEVFMFKLMNEFIIIFRGLCYIEENRITSVSRWKVGNVLLVKSQNEAYGIGENIKSFYVSLSSCTDIQFNPINIVGIRIPVWHPALKKPTKILQSISSRDLQHLIFFLTK